MASSTTVSRVPGAVMDGSLCPSRRGGRELVAKEEAEYFVAWARDILSSGVTHGDLARCLGVTRPTLRSWLKGTRSPSRNSFGGAR